jgi:hypothetical protein
MQMLQSAIGIRKFSNFTRQHSMLILNIQSWEDLLRCLSSNRTDLVSKLMNIHRIYFQNPEVTYMHHCQKKMKYFKNNQKYTFFLE